MADACTCIGSTGGFRYFAFPADGHGFDDAGGFLAEVAGLIDVMQLFLQILE